MKRHLIAFAIGVITIWFMTAFIYAEINPFKLHSEVRQTMVGIFAFSQMCIQAFIAMYNANEL